MNDATYGWTYAGLNVASAVEQIAGNRYLSTHAKVSDLNNTHVKTLSNKLKIDIIQNGIKNPLDFLVI